MIAQVSEGKHTENGNLMWTSGKTCLILISVGIQIVKTWPIGIDPLGLRNIQLEVSEKLPQG